MEILTRLDEAVQRVREAQTRKDELVEERNAARDLTKRIETLVEEARRDLDVARAELFKAAQA